MKKNKKYMLFGQAEIDNKLPNMLMPGEDSTESNQYSGEGSKRKSQSPISQTFLP